MKIINCYCGENFEVDVKEEINLNDNPSIAEQVINNKFMEYTCPSCHKVLTPEFKTRFYDDEFDLTMIPEIERDSFLAGKISIKSKQIVIGFPELREKFIIKNYHYDDRIIELIKLYLIEKVDSKKDVRILFNNTEDNNLFFHIQGLKENEIGISKIPEYIYNNIKNNLEERIKDPEIIDLLSLPYRSVNTISPEVH